jgi:hypothetical protein
MGPLFVAVGWLMLAAVVFLPAFGVAMVMLRSVTRAFVLSAVFTIGALPGGFLAFAIPTVLHGDVPRGEVHGATPLGLYIGAAAIGGGLLAVYLLGRLSKYPPWRRY